MDDPTRKSRIRNLVSYEGVPNVSSDVQNEPLDIFSRLRISQNLTMIDTLENVMVNLKMKFVINVLFSGGPRNTR